MFHRSRLWYLSDLSDLRPAGGGRRAGLCRFFGGFRENGRFLGDGHWGTCLWRRRDRQWGDGRSWFGAGEPKSDSGVLDHAENRVERPPPSGIQGLEVGPGQQCEHESKQGQEQEHRQKAGTSMGRRFLEDRLEYLNILVPFGLPGLVIE
jgi:hypothetical protein